MAKKQKFVKSWSQEITKLRKQNMNKSNTKTSIAKTKNKRIKKMN